jgi:hypothetical protein
MIEHQYAPPIQLYSVSEPEAGEMVAGATRYEGLIWRICLFNIGAGPAWLDNMNIEISPALGRPVWTSLGGLCILLDRGSNEVNLRKPIIIDGHGDVSLVVVIHGENTKEHLQRAFGTQEKFIMRVRAYQRRRLAGYNKSGWLRLASGTFRLPQKFGQTPRHTVIVPPQEELPKFHQP